MGTPTTNVSGRFAVDPSVSSISDFDAGSEQYEFTSESIRMVQTHVGGDGIRGTRSHVKDRVRIAQEAVGGSVVMNPTPIELDLWLPRILGANEATDTFALAETLPEFGMLFDRGPRRFVYTGCKVGRGTFSGSQGQLLQMALDILGKTEIATATSWPATIPAIDSAQGYVFSDVTFALAADASASQVISFELAIDNVLSADLYRNSVTRSEIVALDRIITLNMVLPWTADEVDLYDQAVAGNSGTLTFTNGGCSTLFSFANLKAPAESPNITSRNGETVLNLNMRAYMSGSTRELVVTHDSAA